VGQIALHDYLSQIEWLIEENRLAQAAAHCKQILSQYPYHVDTYRLLGRTLLEQQQFRDAEDVYLRVLSADPEDLVAHAGLTLIYRGFGDGVRAMWHLRCAYDMEPYNRAIQEELAELMASQEDLDLDSMSLSPGALGRIYFRGSHYRQAASELKAALTESPDRLDLQVLLAEALYCDERRVDAINVCLDILEHLPSCVKANAILAVVWTAGGLTEEAQEHVRKLWSLTLADQKRCDDTTLIGQALCHNGALTLPDQIYVKELDYAPTATELMTEEVIRDHDVEVRVPDKSAIPDWLKEPAGSRLTEQSDAKTLNNEDQEMLDWLEGVAVAEGDLFDNVDDLDEHIKHPSTESNSNEFTLEPEENPSPIVEKVDIELELENVFEELGVQNEGSQLTDESTGSKELEQGLEHGSIKHLVEIGDESDTETNSIPDDETYGPLTALLNDLAKSPSDVEENDLNWLFDESQFNGEIELEDTDELPGWMVDDGTADQRDVSKLSASGPGSKEDIGDSQAEYDKFEQTDTIERWKQGSATDLNDMQQDEASDWDLDGPGGERIDEQVKGWDQSSEKLPNAEHGQSSNPAWLTILAAEKLISDVEGNDQKHSVASQEHAEDQPLVVGDESDQVQDIDALSNIELEVNPEVTVKSVDDAYDTNELTDIALDREFDADQESSDTDELDDKAKISKEDNQSPASWLEALSNEDRGSKEYAESSSSIVDEIKDSDEIEGEEPDWLYDAIGFTSSLDLPEPDELPNWYQEVAKEQNIQDDASMPVEEDENENDKPADIPENLEAEPSDLDLPSAEIHSQYSEQTAHGAATWLAALAGENKDEGISTADDLNNSSDLNWLEPDPVIGESLAQSEESTELEKIGRNQQLSEIDEEEHSDHESAVEDRVSHWLEDLTEDSAPIEPIQGSSNVKKDSDINMLSTLREDTNESASAPDWLFDAIGFTGALDLSETGELPGWLDESRLESEPPPNDYSRPKATIDAAEEAISLDQADSPEKPIENEKNDSLVYDKQYLDDFMKGATTWLDALATEGEPESKSGTSLEEWLAHDKDESEEGGFPEWLGALMNNEYTEDEIGDSTTSVSNDEQDDEGG
jgi:tetratricopeptide (TPR) repeat protein